MLWVSNTTGIQASLMQHQRILVCSIHILPFAACLYHSTCYCCSKAGMMTAKSLGIIVCITGSWSRLYGLTIQEDASLTWYWVNAAHHIEVCFQSTTNTWVTTLMPMQVCTQLGLQVPEARSAVSDVLWSCMHRIACNSTVTKRIRIKARLSIWNAEQALAISTCYCSVWAYDSVFVQLVLPMFSLHFSLENVHITVCAPSQWGINKSSCPFSSATLHMWICCSWCPSYMNILFWHFTRFWHLEEY